MPRKRSIPECYTPEGQLTDGVPSAVRNEKSQYFELYGQHWVRIWEDHSKHEKKRVFKITKAEKEPGYWREGRRVARSATKARKKYVLEKWGAVGEEGKGRKRKRGRKWI